MGRWTKRERTFGDSYWENELGERLSEKADSFGRKYLEDKDGNRTYQEEYKGWCGKYIVNQDGHKQYLRENSAGLQYWEDEKGHRTYVGKDAFGQEIKIDGDDVLWGDDFSRPSENDSIHNRTNNRTNNSANSSTNHSLNNSWLVLPLVNRVVVKTEKIRDKQIMGWVILFTIVFLVPSLFFVLSNEDTGVGKVLLTGTSLYLGLFLMGLGVGMAVLLKDTIQGKKHAGRKLLELLACILFFLLVYFFLR